MLLRINTHFTAELYLIYYFIFSCFFLFFLSGQLGNGVLAWFIFALLMPLMKLLITFCSDTTAAWICMRGHLHVRWWEQHRSKMLNIHLVYCFGELLCIGNICWLKAHHVQGRVNLWLTCKCQHSSFIHFYPNINGTRLYSKPELKQMARFSLRPRSWHFLDLLCMWMGCREFRCN